MRRTCMETQISVAFSQVDLVFILYTVTTPYLQSLTLLTLLLKQAPHSLIAPPQINVACCKIEH